MMTLSDPNNNHTSNILLVNVYFPSDYGTRDSHNNFLDTIAELEGFISSHEYDNLILCGDFNVDFCRPGHNLDNFRSFMCDQDLTCTDISSNLKEATW